MYRKVIINLLPINSGGGLQNALSFINSSNDESYLYIVRQNGLLHAACVNNGKKHITVKNSFFSRIFFELTCRRLFNKGDKCFTYFGPPLLSCVNYLYNINGFAYSNLLHPEVDFWKWCGGFDKVKKQLIDSYRIKMMSTSDELIFETELLLERARSFKAFKDVKSLHVVKMSPTFFSISPNENTNKYLNHMDCSVFKILYLTGYHPNKRLDKLSRIAKYIKENQLNIQILVTLTDEDYSRCFISEEYKNIIVNIRPVIQSDIGSLLNCVDAMINIAVLESFSNNFVEAWSFDKCLIVTDDDWARRSCLDAAFYMDIDSYSSIESVINSIIDVEQYKNKVIAGKKMLEQMPTLKKKNEMYNEIIMRKNT